MKYRAKNPVQPGMRFGKWTVCQVLRADERHKALVLCECGNHKISEIANLTRGMSQSCGYCIEGPARQFRKEWHRKSNTKAYAAWASMKQRSTNPNASNYGNYGGRGIKICDRWMDFKLFIEDMGQCEVGRSLERVDNNGNYEPSNCRWATRREQCANRRNSIFVIVDGQRMILADACRKIERRGPVLYRWAKLNSATLQQAVDFFANKAKRASPAVHLAELLGSPQVNA